MLLDRVISNKRSYYWKNDIFTTNLHLPQNVYLSYVIRILGKILRIFLKILQRNFACALPMYTIYVKH